MGQDIAKSAGVLPSQRLSAAELEIAKRALVRELLYSRADIDRYLSGSDSW
jgi:hypothetical protein